MRDSIWIKVEVMAGSSAESVAMELAELAAHMRVALEAEFCGVKMFCRPFQLANDVLAEYERECKLQNYPQS